MDWVRGEEIGHGGFATINLATVRGSCGDDGLGEPRLPPLMAVKSCELSLSASLKNEGRVLSLLAGCPEVIRCYGDSVTVEEGEELYNLLLEYAPGGSLANELKSRGTALPEPEIRRHTRSILRGLRFIHSKGFVHCDLKLDNVLVFPQGEVKIADFGLSKKAGEHVKGGEKQKGFEWRGTPMYMSPESVNQNEYEPPSDIWALGCAVVEMATGRPAWGVGPDTNAYTLMMRIGVGDEIPEVPEGLSEQGKDFLIKCFAKNPKTRWSADMLLKHPFIAAGDDCDIEIVMEEDRNVVGFIGGDCGGVEFESLRETSSPRCPFDFLDWASLQCSSSEFDQFTTRSSVPDFDSDSSSSGDDDSVFNCFSPEDRIQQLATSEECPDWGQCDSWITVRCRRVKSVPTGGNVTAGSP